MPTNSKRYRAAFVGVGAMGLRHARAFASLPERYEIAGAYDVRADAVPHGTTRLRSEEEAIARADVVVVATPTSAHTGPVARALAAGRCVLVEKPLCATAREASALASLAGPGRLFVGHSERFNPVVRALARLLGAEPVLALDLLRVGRSRPNDGGALVNLGVHDFDLAVCLGGGPLALRAAYGARPWSASDPKSGEDLAHVLFTTGAGAAGHLFVDRTAPAKRRQLTLATAEWLYEGDLLGHRLVRVARSTGARVEVPLPGGEPLVEQAAALASAIDAIDALGASAAGAAASKRPGDNGSDRPPLATGGDGAYAVSLAENAASLLLRPNEAGPIESRAREKLVATKAPLLPRE